MTLANANLLVLAVIVPLALSVVIALIGRRWRPAAPVLAALAPATVLWVALSSLSRVASGSPDAPWTSALASRGSVAWFELEGVSLPIGWTVDSLAALMLLVVGVVALCVVVFSAGYLAGDAGWARYFALIALFTGSMSLLVVGDSFLTLFMGWELVGACSYLLIGFWFEKPRATAAAVKAFLTTRVGDVGLLLGIALLWQGTGALGYEQVMAGLGSMSPAALSAAGVCLAVGAMGKSAQFPLHAWLPDAMEGPTPVSALIHAATMVAAGVYLGARIWPVFEAAPAALALLLGAGVVSAVGAALAATVQRDIKKVLAYSTISQLGFMFAALGVGAWGAAFFHLMTHAGFKALLFLGSGSVIHGAGSQDIHEMGGLRKAMPITFTTWVIGALALAGIAPLSGFFSKDAVLESVWHAQPAVGALLFAASAITAFYAARVTRLVFFGDSAPNLRAHESPLSMLVPLVVLAIPAFALGLAHTPVMELLQLHPEPLALPVSAAALALAAIGGVVGWVSSAGPVGDAATRARLGRAGDLLADAYRWDGLVDRAVVRPVVTACLTLWAVGDRLLADGLAEGSAVLARGGSRVLSRLQSGDAQSYEAALVAGAALMLAAASWLGR